LTNLLADIIELLKTSMPLIKRYLIFLVLNILYLISCTGNNKEFYNKNDIDIDPLVNQNNNKYLLFNIKSQSSLNWPDNALCEYNYDSTRVKLRIRRYSAMLTNAKPDSNSIIKVVRDCADLKLNYKNSKDSLLKSTWYVVRLPLSVSEIILSN
jgi:hypothetical protein